MKRRHHETGEHINEFEEEKVPSKKQELNEQKKVQLEVSAESESRHSKGIDNEEPSAVDVTATAAAAEEKISVSNLPIASSQVVAVVPSIKQP